MLRYYLAIDQGGTKTDAIVFTRDGEILAHGNDRAIRSPEENYTRQQAQFIRVAADNALSAAGIAIDQIDGVWGALNGADWAHDYPRLTRLTAGALAIDEQKITIINDCIGAMRGGTDDKRCAVICVGSGLNIAVRAESGEEIIYGYFIAQQDQGGGALGEAAWQAAVDAWNGLGEPTAITDALLQQYQKDDLQSLYIAFTDGEIPMQHKKMAPALMRVAQERDPVALRIVNAAGERLSQYVHQAMKKLSIAGKPLTLVVSGGVTKGAGIVLTESIKRHIQAIEPNVHCVDAPYEPVAGTALVGLDALCDRHIPDDIKETFRLSALRHGLFRNGTKGEKEP